MISRCKKVSHASAVPAKIQTIGKIEITNIINVQIIPAHFLEPYLEGIKRFTRSQASYS